MPKITDKAIYTMTGVAFIIYHVGEFKKNLETQAYNKLNFLLTWAKYSEPGAENW